MLERDHHKGDCHASCFFKIYFIESIQFKDWIDSPWSGFFEGKEQTMCSPTGIAEDTLNHIATVFSSPPPNSPMFVLHKGIERVLNGRKKLIESRQADWALGEAFAIGSLLKDGALFVEKISFVSTKFKTKFFSRDSCKNIRSGC